MRLNSPLPGHAAGPEQAAQHPSSGCRIKPHFSIGEARHFRGWEVNGVESSVAALPACPRFWGARRCHKLPKTTTGPVLPRLQPRFAAAAPYISGGSMATLSISGRAAGRRSPQPPAAGTHATAARGRWGRPLTAGAARPPLTSPPSPPPPPLLPGPGAGPSRPASPPASSSSCAAGGGEGDAAVLLLLPLLLPPACCQPSHSQGRCACSSSRRLRR